MIFTFMFLVISECVSLLQVHAVYDKNVVCISDQRGLCETINSKSRRNNNKIPSHAPYIPPSRAVFYNCSSLQCEAIKIHSITQVTPLESELKICYRALNKKYECNPLNYYNYKDVDKLSFLSNIIPDKTFYLIDCLAYADGGRVCHKKNEVDSHTKLVDTGNIARPNEPNILSQNEFICQQSSTSVIICDLNRYVHYIDGLKLKNIGTIDKKILLKTGNTMFILNYTCIGYWCGYIGTVQLKRINRRFEGSTNKVYRCYYANKQQVCKMMHGIQKNMYNKRDWVHS